MHKAWNRMKSVLYRDSAVAVLLKTGEIHHLFFVQAELGFSGWLSSAFSHSKVLVLFFFFSFFLSLFCSAFLIIFIYGFPETFLYFTATGRSSKSSRPQSFYQDDDL